MGWEVGISTRTPRTSSGFTPTPYPSGSGAVVEATSHQRDVELEAVLDDLSLHPLVVEPGGVGAAAPQGLLTQDVLGETELALGGTLEGTQVAHVDARVDECPAGASHPRSAASKWSRDLGSSP